MYSLLSLPVLSLCAHADTGTKGISCRMPNGRDIQARRRRATLTQFELASRSGWQHRKKQQCAYVFSPRGASPRAILQKHNTKHTDQSKTQPRQNPTARDGSTHVQRRDPHNQRAQTTGGTAKQRTQRRTATTHRSAVATSPDAPANAKRTHTAKRQHGSPFRVDLGQHRGALLLAVVAVHLFHVHHCGEANGTDSRRGVSARVRRSEAGSRYGHNDGGQSGGSLSWQARGLVHRAE